MTAVLLIVAAAVALAWPSIQQRIKGVSMPALDTRHLVAAALAAAGVFLWASGRGPAPTPAPPEPVAFTLRGKFVGPDASADAAKTAWLLEELANEIEWDGMQPEPFLKTGVAFDELRIRARLLLCRGVSLGDKHPRAREAIKAYLDQAAGTSGGPVSPQQRAAWIAAYRDVSRAAADAAR
jgi:hypothetical protein